MEFIIGATIGIAMLVVNELMPIENQVIRTSRNECYMKYKIKNIDECKEHEKELVKGDSHEL